MKKNAVDVVYRLSHEEFYKTYVSHGVPVVIKDSMNGGQVSKKWNLDYFELLGKDLKILVKGPDVADGKRQSMFLSEYIQLIKSFEAAIKMGENPPRPPYVHDIPIFDLLPSLVNDVDTFPLELLPKWYRKDWYKYVQFFLGGTGSLTPLHFDTLCTHNLFFQITGSKRFILIPSEQKDQCYIKGWRWARFNPDNPDFERFPKARTLDIREVKLDPGDVLYIPSGMLHQVHGQSSSISFNIDWHTPRSSWKGILSYTKGAPRENLYYNFLIFMGLNLGISSKYIFRYYQPYLNYVS